MRDSACRGPAADPGRVRCVQRAYLTFAPATDDVDFDPAEVSRVAGLAPTHSHKRGDPIGAAGRRHRRRSSWRVEVPERDEYDTDVVLGELLDLIEPHAQGIARACDRLRLRGGINVVIEMYAGRDDEGELVVTTPALSLSAQTVRRIADLHLWLDCDQYVYQ